MLAGNDYFVGHEFVLCRLKLAWWTEACSVGWWLMAGAGLF
jgi:hypothetical protein